MVGPQGTVRTKELVGTFRSQKDLRGQWGPQGAGGTLGSWWEPHEDGGTPRSQGDSHGGTLRNCLVPGELVGPQENPKELVGTQGSR